MRELADTARRWTAQDRRAVLARPITEQGFGPRQPADAIVVDEDGACLGTLYRGVFDAYLADEAARILAGQTARVCEVSGYDDEAKEARLTCGGQAEIQPQLLHALSAGWWDLLAEGADAALVTCLDAPQTHAVSTVVGPARTDVAAPAEAAEQARHLLARHRAGREVRYTDARLVLSETFPAVPHLVIAGGSELAELLTAQAQLLGRQATVTYSAPDACMLLTDRQTACLVMLNHERDVEVPTLRTALTAGVVYVAALGSRRIQARRAAALVKAGLDEDLLRFIHGPIGAWTPAPAPRRRRP